MVVNIIIVSAIVIYGTFVITGMIKKYLVAKRTGSSVGCCGCSAGKSCGCKNNGSCHN